MVPSTRSPSTTCWQFTAVSQATPPAGTRTASRRVESSPTRTARSSTDASSSEWKSAFSTTSDTAHGRPSSATSRPIRVIPWATLRRGAVACTRVPDVIWAYRLSLPPPSTSSSWLGAANRADTAWLGERRDIHTLNRPATHRA
jgi:hypothetical protein